MIKMQRKRLMGVCRAPNSSNQHRHSSSKKGSNSSSKGSNSSNKGSNKGSNSSSKGSNSSSNKGSNSSNNLPWLVVLTISLGELTSTSSTSLPPCHKDPPRVVSRPLEEEEELGPVLGPVKQVLPAQQTLNLGCPCSSVFHCKLLRGAKSRVSHHNYQSFLLP